MNILDSIRPNQKQRVIDLVQAAGVDVTDWAKVSGGKSPASNPKYCYEWSFLESGVVLVVNLWFDELIDDGGIVHREMNLRELFPHYTGARLTRAQKLDRDLALAAKTNLPVKVIVCEGDRRDISDANSKASRVKTRLLDAAIWSVSYNAANGDISLTRGTGHSKYCDQFDTSLEKPARVKTTTTKTYSRNPAIRSLVLERACGKCELCGQAGFEMPDGKIYLETHHVIPLSKGGDDSTSNVIALCPNDHRKAHHSIDKDSIRDSLLSLLKSM